MTKLERALCTLFFDQGTLEGYKSEVLGRYTAPVFERALRAAWVQGGTDAMAMHCGHHTDFLSDNGVTAGIAAMEVP